MKGGKTPLGYTIIEVMIVLAVSALMFLAAASFINGKQGRTAFTVGTNELSSSMQDIIEQVNNGKYSDVNLKCSFSAAGSTSVSTAPLSSKDYQGTNAECVFVGKLIQFAPTDGLSSTATENYRKYSLVAGRVDKNGLPITDLVQGDADIISQLDKDELLPPQMEISKVKVKVRNPVGGPDLVKTSYGIGFFQSLGTVTDGALQSGTGSINLYYVVGVNQPMDKGASSGPNNTFEYYLDKGSGRLAANLKPANAAYICVTDGTRNAQIIIGLNNSGLSSTVKVVDDNTCVV